MKKKSLFGENRKEVEIGDIVYLAKDKPLQLQSGRQISNFPLAYKTCGTLNEDKTNVILICHALTADQYFFDKNPITGKDGWWSFMVGSGKPIDTDKYFVICSNVIGGCMGSFGPKETNPTTGQPYNLDFPIITIKDMVNAQKLLIESLGIEKIFSVIGGSMGGMQALEWSLHHHNMVKSAIVIASSMRHTAQNIAFNEISRRAIMFDSNWCRGNYLNEEKFPTSGLALARMVAHITYISENGLQDKFGRNLQDKEEISYGFNTDFQVESYLKYQGNNFINRFDPNSYLFITRAMDYFDLEKEYKNFHNSPTKHCIISFDSDWLFPTEESKKIVKMLHAAVADVSFSEIKTDKGHDSFLIPNEDFMHTIKSFLEGVARVF